VLPPPRGARVGGGAMPVARGGLLGSVVDVRVHERAQVCTEGVTLVLPHLTLHLDRTDGQHVGVGDQPRRTLGRQRRVTAEHLQRHRLQRRVRQRRKRRVQQGIAPAKAVRVRVRAPARR
jgi:hypothetical protein